MTSAFQKAREPMSSYTHFLGAIASLFATALMVLKACLDPGFTTVRLVSVILFGVSMVVLYSASALYHFSNARPSIVQILRRLDHSVIFVLIAGTYTPICLNMMEAPTNVIFTGAIWAVGILGIVVKMCWFYAPRWLSTLFYLLMGWSIVLDFGAVLAMPLWAIVFLVLGGISYTIGGVIYIVKKPNISESFGFHELFHIFVLAGTFFHFLLVLFFIA
ncbi:MAG TPA: hemolysin III family protein [Firmicutes bacterium]|nr:hemolysin III family protein [Bacillota bacterium]